MAIQQANTSRGGDTNTNTNNIATANTMGAATLNPNQDCFPGGRKQSGPSSLYNSEAYKAYYTHSAAANSSQTVGQVTGQAANDADEYKQKISPKLTLNLNIA